MSYHNFNRDLKHPLAYPDCHVLEEKATFWAEKTDGSHVRLVDLLPSARSMKKWKHGGSDTSRVLPELSTHLWVRNMVVRLRFCDAYRFSFENGWFYAAVDFNSGVRGRVESVYLSRKQDDPKFQRLMTQTWDCLLVCRTRHDWLGLEYDWSFLILEWSGDTAYRVGTLHIGVYSMYDYQVFLREVPHSVRKIRLG